MNKYPSMFLVKSVDTLIHTNEREHDVSIIIIYHYYFLSLLLTPCWLVCVLHVRVTRSTASMVSLTFHSSHTRVWRVACTSFDGDGIVCSFALYYFHLSRIISRRMNKCPSVLQCKHPSKYFAHRLYINIFSMEDCSPRFRCVDGAVAHR